jgi:hypothetical protein
LRGIRKTAARNGAHVPPETPIVDSGEDVSDPGVADDPPQVHGDEGISAPRGADVIPPVVQPPLNVPDKDGIFRDGTGRLYKLDPLGRRYTVDATGTRVFQYKDGRQTSRPPELNHIVWDYMNKRQRAAYMKRRGNPGSSTDAPDTAPPVVTVVPLPCPSISAIVGAGACDGQRASAPRGAGLAVVHPAGATDGAGCDDEPPPWITWDELACEDNAVPAVALASHDRGQGAGIPSMPCCSSPREHRTKLAQRFFPHNACIARSVTKAEIAWVPAVQKATQVEWGRLRAKGVWDDAIVCEWDDVAAEARSAGEHVRASLGYLFGICVEK